MAMHFLLDSCPHKKSAPTRSTLVHNLNDPLVSGQKSMHLGTEMLLQSKLKTTLLSLHFTNSEQDIENLMALFKFNILNHQSKMGSLPWIF